MGAWGYESCANDNCWDNLWAENIHKMTQKEADDSLEKCFDGKTFRSTDEKQTGLGVVIWILRQGLKVDGKYLKRAAKFAVDLREDKEYLSEWNSETKRKENLDRELGEINESLKNDGQGNKQHVPGLFEHMAEKFGAMA